jgi:glycosyltransferase involved in cell wall biosynthesis
MAKIKIMHLLESNRFSGAENVVCQIIDLCQPDDKYEFYYCSSDGPIRDTLIKRKINYIGLKKFSVSEIRRAIETINPDIIHAHDMRASFMASLLSGKRKLIMTIHNNAPENANRNVKTILFNWASKKASHVFWVSESAFNDYYYIDNIRNKSSVLYNIIDIPSLYRKANEDQNNYDYDILFLGRLTTQKDPHRLLSIFRKIADILPQVKLAIAGTGPMEEEIKKEANELDLTKNLKFLGFIDNPYKVLKSSSLMIMTSRWEGTPMSSLEAMALGVPIVSTPTDGLKQVVIDGKTGFLSNDDKRIIDACVKLIQDTALRENLSKNSIARAKELMDPDFFRDEIEKVYDE